MLEVRNLNHHYGRVQVLKDLNFTINQGEILGFLGPNGAGKSTTMRILTGYLTPTSGEVLFNGENIQKNIVSLRKGLGYMPENAPLYPELKVGEYLNWAARIKRSSKPAEQVAMVLNRCGLDSVKTMLIGRLSKGFRQRVCLAQAILGETRLLILDEPTVGLDPGQIREIRSLIRELGRDKTIILSTHILPEVELTCDRVLIINNGRIVTEDTPSNLASAFGGCARFLLRLDPALAGEDQVLSFYREKAYIASIEPASSNLGPGCYMVETRAGADHRAALTKDGFERGFGLLEFRPADASLEDAFVNLVREETMQGEAK